MQTSNGKGQIGLMSERPLFANVLLKPFKFGKLVKFGNEVIFGTTHTT